MNATAKYEKMKRASLEVLHIASLLELPERIKEELEMLYFKLIELKGTQGRASERVIGALVYYLAKRQDLPYTLSEIAEKIGTDRWSLFKSFKGIKGRIGLMCTNKSCESLVFKYNNELKLSESTLFRATVLLKQMEELSNTPIVKVATALYLAGRQNLEEASMRRIANVCGCSECAITMLQKLF